MPGLRSTFDAEEMAVMEAANKKKQPPDAPDELLNGELFYTLREAQPLIERRRVFYNTVRPHSSLGYRPPAPETVLPTQEIPQQQQAA